MTEPEATDFLDESVEVIKGLRRNAKHRQTLLIKRIDDHCHIEKGSRTVVQLHRQTLVSLQDELTRMNAALASKSPAEDVEHYQRELDDRVATCFQLMEDYLQSREGDTASVVTGRSRSSDVRSQLSRASDQSRSQLREVTKRRELAELELEQQREFAEREQQQRREQQRMMQLEQQQRLERLRLEEVQAARDYQEDPADWTSQVSNAVDESRVEEEHPPAEELARQSDVVTIDPSLSPEIHDPSYVPNQLMSAANQRSSASPTVATGPSHNTRARTESTTVRSSPIISGIVAPSVTPQPRDRPTSDGWIRDPQAVNATQRHQHGLPQLKLEAFDGDFAKWPDFAAGFKALVHDAVQSDYQRMAFLRMYLSPTVRSSIACQLSDPSRYWEALQSLKDMYGHPMLIAKANYQALANFPNVKPGDLKSLERFTGCFNDAVSGLLKTGHDSDIYSIMTMESVLAKLPSCIKNEWGDQIMLMNSEHSLLELKDWLHRKIMGRRMVNAGQLPQDRRHEKHQTNFQRDTRRTVNAVQKTSENSSCPHCDQSHFLHSCEKFRSIESADERFQIVRQQGLCFRCLRHGHIGSGCPKPRKQCGENGCKSSHHILIHGSKRSSQEGETQQDGNKVVRALRMISEHPIPDNTITLINIVPILLKDGKKSVATYAMIDPGAEVTLIRRDVAEKLDLQTSPSPWSIESWSGNEPTCKTLSVDLTFSNRDENFQLKAENAQVVPTINVSGRLVNWDLLKEDWPHLEGLEMPKVWPEEVGVLIGQDVDDAMEILLTRKSDKPLAPVAKLTRFGWTIVGKISNRYQWHESKRKHNVCLIRKRPSNAELMASMERFWNIESFGIKSTSRLMTLEDKKAVKIIESTIQKIDGRYEVGLPWMHDDLVLPNNRDSALKRFYGLEKRFINKPDYSARYAKVIDQYISLGHAIRLKSEDLFGPDGRTWYLPHHGVEQSGKLRVVFDASAQYLGQSLNDHLLQGPDLMTPLFAVLIHFREKAYAVSADIEKMFNQVLVRKMDRDALRFLLRPTGSNRPPETYRMEVQTFGVVSSPTICNYALQRAATDCAEEFPDASNRVIENFYVDNYLDSFDSEPEAITVTSNVSKILERGCFKLTKWLSSSKMILAQKPVNLRIAPNLDLEIDDLPSEKTLGIHWNAELDVFKFRIQLKEIRPTRREMFSEFSKIYDPLGFIAPVKLMAGVLLQESWQTDQSWDNELPSHMIDRWKRWYTDLTLLEELQIPRSFKPFEESVTNAQLHVFCDASERGFGAVAYLRTVPPSGVHVGFVAAKAHVSPLKTLTIPKLELQGAVIALRLATTLKKDLRIEVGEPIFWSDSACVVSWVHSKKFRFKPFVENRVAEILEGSQPKQWRHVPGTENPADYASRGLHPAELTSHHPWFDGPAFLWQDEEHWPILSPQPETKEDDPEIRKSSRIVVSSISVTKPIEGIVYQLLNRTNHVWFAARVLARVRRWLHNHRASHNLVDKDPKRTRTGWIQPMESRESMRIFVQEAQLLHFAPEIRALSTGLPLPTNSRLKRLAPFVDEDGILRVGGRIEHVPFSRDRKHPMILPDSRLCEMIISDLHICLAHSSPERTLADYQVRYWSLGVRRIVRRVVSSCPACIKNRAKPSTPVMAALPAVRLQTSQPPFCGTGVDFFGPLYVNVKRSTAKRWGCIFTCLVTRAVHLEIVHTMDASSFISALRRFIARRGSPTVIYSDNGTNLTAGEKELREAIGQWNSEIIGRAA